MRATRAFVLPYVMLICVVLVGITALLLTSAQELEQRTQSIEGKNDTFNAAEAGLNAALDSLNLSQSASGTQQGTLANGYQYSYTIYPNEGSLGSSIADPIKGIGQVTIPGGSAMIVSHGSGPHGERPATVEALVTAHVATVQFQKYAIIAGRNIQGAYQGSIVDAGNGKGALIHADGSINASISGTLAGYASASGNTNTLPPGTTQVKSIALPTVSQFDTMVSDYENQTKVAAGPSNIYAEDGSLLATSYTCPSTPATTCLLFYDGKLASSSQQISFIGAWTVVVNGDFMQSGVAKMSFSGQSGLLIVNGNASIDGNGVVNAYVEVKGSTLLGGAGGLTGAMISLSNVSFDSTNSSATFTFDGSVVPPSKTIAGRVKVVTYAEY